jgi:hypothetical protein
LLVLITLANSAPVFWAKWNATPITENGVTKYTGNISVKRPSGQFVDVGIKVTSTKGLAFVQDGSASQIDYWMSGSPNSPYKSTAIDNDPTPKSVVAFSSATDVTVEFSQPMGNFYLAYISINSNTWSFTQNFDILSNGTGYWGGGPVVKEIVGTKYQLRSLSGDPHGALGFKGTFSTFSWSVLASENWNGFTLGTYGLDADVNTPTGCADFISKIPTYCCSSIGTKALMGEASAMDQTDQSRPPTGGLSTSMTVLVAVLSAMGTSILIIGISFFAGYTIVKKGQIGSGLAQQLQ